ncbi:hypothetical protein EW146_g8432 [Bondarzewia mesenterica]|uniref:Aminoglycoside phosphotransferase domain-containing protein n=1 Tax=Bondarzewia mesenterica TaxID=1095465 RepID=A0A4S4LEY1_9AGAM|nr:hypothetical protein EW146_g8432 [Bondarzewia mesenterica]
MRLPSHSLSKATKLWLPKSYDDLDAITSPNVLYDLGRFGKRVVRTADGVVIKYGGDELAEEVLCTRFAHEKLSLPVPRILHYPGSARRRVSWTMPPPVAATGPTGVWYICMEEVPGASLDKVIDTLSEQQLDHIAGQLKSIIARIGSVKSKTLGSITGDPYRTLLVYPAYQPKQAFTTVAEFRDHFHRLLLMCPGGEREANELLNRIPRNAAIRFTHGDLVPKNIMVDGSAITGIIDWANAGFYPEFWEYCRMHSPDLMTPQWSRVLETVFPGERRQEEIDAVEKMLFDISWFL